MQVADGLVKSVRLDDRPGQGWQRMHLMERIQDLDAKNGLLRARLLDARDRVRRLEAENRHLREKLLQAVGASPQAR